MTPEEYDGWKKGLFCNYCKGQDGRFRGEICPHLGPGRKCNMLMKQASQRHQRSTLGRCVEEIVYTVLSFYEEKYLYYKTRRIAGPQLVQYFPGQNLKHPTIGGLVTWVDSAVQRRLFQGYSRHICRNCGHFSLYSNECLMDPNRSRRRTNIPVPTSRKGALPNRNYVLCDDFAYRQPKEAPSKENLPEVPVTPTVETELEVKEIHSKLTQWANAPGISKPERDRRCGVLEFLETSTDNKLILMELFSSLIHWASAPNITKKKREKRARALDLFVTMLMECGGKLPPDDHDYYKRWGTSRSTAKNDMKLIKEVLRKKEQEIN